MPSRKRSKGKARKAKALKAKETNIQSKNIADTTVVAAEDDTRTLRVLRSWFTRQLQDVTICSHDCPPLPRAHVGKELLDAIINKSREACMGSSNERTGATLTQAVEEFERKYPDIWADCSIRELIRKSFLGRSIDIVLQHEDEGYLMAAGMLATASLMLEPDYAFTELNAKQQLKLADVLEGDKRSLIDFFSKRITCQCIDKMSKDSTTLRKTGMCQCCYERFGWFAHAVRHSNTVVQVVRRRTGLSIKRPATKFERISPAHKVT